MPNRDQVLLVATNTPCCSLSSTYSRRLFSVYSNNVSFFRTAHILFHDRSLVLCCMKEYIIKKTNTHQFENNDYISLKFTDHSKRISDSKTTTYNQDLNRKHRSSSTNLSICSSHFTRQNTLSGTVSSASSRKLKLASAVSGYRIHGF